MLSPGGGAGADLPDSWDAYGLMWDSAPAKGKFTYNEQVAELVAVERHHMSVTTAAGPEPNKSGFVKFEAQLQGSIEPWGQTAGTWEDRPVDVFTGGDATDSELISAFNVNRTKEWASHYLENVAVMSMPQKDDGAGNGGPGTPGVVNNVFKNLRELYGRGPLYTDPEDYTALRCQYEVQARNNPDLPTNIKVVDSTYWDIHELTEPLERVDLRDI